jgi:putative Ca2+/H+ antiporter (TMEM165/GDT1 family)
VNLVVAATTLAVVLPAELPDKSALASLMLGSRYRPAYVFAGVVVAFAAHVALALVAGGLLALLPHRVLSTIVAVLFGVGAILLVKGRSEEDAVDKATAGTPPTFVRVAATSFLVVFVGEFGDLTQIVIVNLAARYHAPLAVGIGSLVALCAVGGLAIAGGRGLLRVVPIRLVTLAGAAVMAVLAVISLIGAIHGLPAPPQSRTPVSPRLVAGPQVGLAGHWC